MFRVGYPNQGNGVVTLDDDAVFLAEGEVNVHDDGLIAAGGRSKLRTENYQLILKNGGAVALEDNAKFEAVSGVNIDSMVAHYTVSKKRRSYDYYSPGGKMGLRPDRATIVYCNRIREAYGDIPIIIGGLEASLRRFAHYDYWEDRVRRSILVDSRADILTYGMGENILRRIARLLDKGVPIKKIRDVRGCVYLAKAGEKIHFDSGEVGDYDLLKTDKAAYAKAFAVQYKNNDSVRGKAVVE